MNYGLTLVGLSALLLASCVPNTGMNHSTGGMNHGGMMQDGATTSVPSWEDIAALPEAKSSSIIEVTDGDTINLDPTMIRKTINGTDLALYGYNGQFPGPTLKVKQGSTFTVNVQNRIDVPTTIHWHGIRLENRFDGAAGVTQDAIEPGGSFTYTVTVPDEGIFWYHPHVREDLQQDKGLYGLLHVTPAEPGTYPDVDREQYMILDDILLGQNGTPPPYGKEEANFAMMGRFGNHILINGSDDREMDTGLGEVVRLYVLNASNTRTYRIVAPPGGMKLVASDLGRIPEETLEQELVLSPAERMIVDLYFFDEDLRDGEPASVTVPIVTAGSPNAPVTVLSANIIGGIYQQSTRFATIEGHEDVSADIDAFRPFFNQPVDHTIHLSAELAMMGGMMDHGGSEDGIEWDDAMAMMNAMATKANTQWKLIDETTGNENMDIHYTFKKGDKVKLRLVNDDAEQGSDHEMQHPIHLHGQRFLVLSDNGVENTQLAWKDTVLVPAGHTVEILVDVTNPGDWMMHCHIAEHLSNGMMGMFTVE